MARNNIWVVHDGDSGWAVRREGTDDVVDRYDTQEAALDAGRALAREEQAELIWQGRDGAIQGRDSYGNDPSGRG